MSVVAMEPASCLGCTPVGSWQPGGITCSCGLHFHDRGLRVGDLPTCPGCGGTLADSERREPE